MKAGPVVRLTVADNGTGIPPDVLPHIFEPFFTNKSPGKGTGLGLAMANGFVRQSHGHIAVDTTPGKGTAFHVYLPRSESEETSLPSSSFMEAAAIGGSETILAVDDEEGIRSLFQDVLQGAGYKVLLACSAEEALEFLRSKPEETVHVLLTDIQLPGRSGLELWQEASALRPNLRVLFSAGTSRESVLTLYPQFPVKGVLLEKPMHINEILRRVREVLS
jgi:CheY-like chemotaxis protein